MDGYDSWGYRSMRRDVQVQDMTGVLTEQPQAAAQAQNGPDGGFKGLAGALNPANPLLWLLVLALLLTGIVAASFHVRVGRHVSAGVTV